MKLLPNDKTVFHMREYAIVKNDNGSYEYVSWDATHGKISWIRGEAKILEDILVLTKITSEGDEETFNTMKSVRRELKKLPDWWNQTKYYCVVLDYYAAMVKHCASGKPLEEGGKEYRSVQDKLFRNGIVLVTEKPE